MKAVTVGPVAAPWRCIGYFPASPSYSKLLDEGFAKRAHRVKPRRALVKFSLADVASDGCYFIAGATLAYPFARSAAVKILQQTRPISCDICKGVGHNTCAMCNGRGRLGGVFPGEPLRGCGKCTYKGRVICEDCRGTGIANNWLYSPAEDGGWGPRGEKL